MPYVDYDYYTNTYLGTFDGAPDEFPRTSKRASEVIDALTMHKIPMVGGLDKYPQFIQNQVKLAVCAQIEHIDLMGGWDEAVASQKGGMGAVKIGNFGYGGSSGRGTGDARSNNWDDNIAGMARTHLMPTGLLHRGIGTHG